jgi:hypothetical protein
MRDTAGQAKSLKENGVKIRRVVRIRISLGAWRRQSGIGTMGSAPPLARHAGSTWGRANHKTKKQCVSVTSKNKIQEVLETVRLFRSCASRQETASDARITPE